MCRGWTLLIVVVLMGGCDGNATDPSTGSGPDSAPRLSGTYKVEQRCNGLGEARVDLSPRGRGGHYFLLVRGGDNPPVYTALDHLELDLAWNNDSEAFAEAGDGLPIYNWQTRLSKDPGWLDDSKGIAQMPEEGRLALHDLNVAMAEARADLHQQAGLRYMEQRRDYQGGSDTEGVRAGHRDRNQHLLNVAALMQADAEQDVPDLARLVAESRPSSEAAVQRYQKELTAYLRAAARAHALWYIEAADIRLDWFNGNYPEGEAAIREGMAQLEHAYLGAANE